MVGQQCTDRDVPHNRHAGCGFASLKNSSLVSSSSRNVTAALTFSLCVCVCVCVTFMTY